METYRKVVPASEIKDFLNLPDSFDGQNVEVIVKPFDLAKNIQSLFGCASRVNMSLEELREERLGSKYEIAR